MLEFLTLIGVVILGAFGAVVAGGAFEIGRALFDRHRGDGIRHRTLRQNIHNMLS